VLAGRVLTGGSALKLENFELKTLAKPPVKTGSTNTD